MGTSEKMTVTKRGCLAHQVLINLVPLSIPGQPRRLLGVLMCPTGTESNPGILRIHVWVTTIQDGLLKQLSWILSRTTGFLSGNVNSVCCPVRRQELVSQKALLWSC